MVVVTGLVVHIQILSVWPELPLYRYLRDYSTLAASDKVEAESHVFDDDFELYGGCFNEQSDESCGLGDNHYSS